MAEAKDVEALKRRGRRRLVGAIALVLAAVIILPMVFDSAPKQALPPVSVRIPSEEDAGFKPKVTPVAPEKIERKADAPRADKPAAQAAAGPIEKPVVAEVAKPAEAAPAKAEEKPAPKPEIKPQPAPEQKPVAKAPEPKAAPKPAAGEQYFVQVGAFADPSGVYEKLKAAKIPFYTEPVATKSGKVMRVRAGPFASREAAQKALLQLRTLGFKPAEVAPKV